MSNLILPQNIATYLGSWEGHTQSEGNNLIQVNDRMNNATIDELATEYNILTLRHLWNLPLLDLFYNEFRNRMFSDTTFSISVSWQSTQEWLKNPFVLIMVGFEENYPIIDGNGINIRGDKPNVLNVTLLWTDFSDKLQEKIIRMLLHNDTSAIIEIFNNQLKIIGLENDSVRLSFMDDDALSEVVKVRTIIRKVSDWDVYSQVYKALRDQTPIIIDPIQNRMIEIADLIDE
jgi:hypothetical protein